MNDEQRRRAVLPCLILQKYRQKGSGGDRAGGLGLALPFLSGKPGDGIAATGTHGP